MISIELNISGVVKPQSNITWNVIQNNYTETSAMHIADFKLINNTC